MTMQPTGLNFEEFADNHHDGILILDGKRLAFTNASLNAMLGYSPDELRNSTLDDIITSGDAERGIYLNQPDGELRIGRYELALRRKDGGYCLAEVNATLGTWHSRPALVLIVRDLSTRRNQEMALREIESHFLQLTQNINEVFFVRDLLENRVIYASPAYEAIWKRPVSALYSNPLDFIESIHPDDRKRIIEGSRHQNIHERGSITHQYRILWPNGEVRWIRSRTFPIQGIAGNAQRVAGIAEDITLQRRTEEKLRLNDLQLRQIIDLVPHAIFVKDFDGRFLLVNKAKADFYGTTVEKLTGALQHDFHSHNAQLEYMQAEDRAVLDSKQPKLIPEEDLVDVHGTVRTLQTVKIPFTTSEDGQPAVLGVAVDITERKRAEQALRLSDERLRLSLRYGNIGTWDWNINTGELYWSELVAPLFGREFGAAETSIDAFLKAVHPDDRRLVENAVRACIESGQDYDIDHRVVWDDGSVHWLHESGGVVYGADGKPERMVGVVRDITRRKTAEQSLLESENKYRAVMENASDAILLGTMDAWIIDANHRAEALFGYPRDELLQLHGTAIHPKEEHPALAAAFHDLTTKGESLYEHLILRKDGSVVNAEVAAKVVEFQGTKVVMAIFRDTTTRKHAEEERLTQAKAQRDTLVREVHHRIKNNLQGVVGLLRQHATKHPGLRGPLESAITQVNSMAVVHGLYGKSSNEHVILCDMVRAICQSTGGLTGTTVQPHVTVAVENPIRVSNEEAVPLALILNELIFNAIKHQAVGREPVHVYVRGDDTGARVHIITTNTQLPAGFDFSSGSGLGTGLRLVKSLLPTGGCQLQMRNEAADVITELLLIPPIIMPNPDA